MSKTDDNYKKLVKTFESMLLKNSVEHLFCDFLELSAIAIQNSYMKDIDREIYDKGEKRYFEIIKKYDECDLEKMAKMLSYLIQESMCRLQSGKMSDILGQFYHHFDLHNVYKGQFFTPQHICDFMATITLSTNYKMIHQKKAILKLANHAAQ